MYRSLFQCSVTFARANIKTFFEHKMCGGLMNQRKMSTFYTMTKIIYRFCELVWSLVSISCPFSGVKVKESTDFRLNFHQKYITVIPRFNILDTPRSKNPYLKVGPEDRTSFLKGLGWVKSGRVGSKKGRVQVLGRLVGPMKRLVGCFR